MIAIKNDNVKTLIVNINNFITEIKKVYNNQDMFNFYSGNLNLENVKISENNNLNLNKILIKNTNNEISKNYLNYNDCKLSKDTLKLSNKSIINQNNYFNFEKGLRTSVITDKTGSNIFYDDNGILKSDFNIRTSGQQFNLFQEKDLNKTSSIKKGNISLPIVSKGYPLYYYTNIRTIGTQYITGCDSKYPFLGILRISSTTARGDNVFLNFREPFCKCANSDLTYQFEFGYRKLSKAIFLLFYSGDNLFFSLFK